MSWYVRKDGQQIWIPRDEAVFTVIAPVEALPLDNLTYLTTISKKSVFQEHLADEEENEKSSRRRKKLAGRQRGFILRVEHEEQPWQRVVPAFQASAITLLKSGAASRIDVEEAVSSKKGKRKAKERLTVNIGANECRVETISRINHFAHGPGFRVEVTEGAISQRILFFTDKKEVPADEWHMSVTTAIEGTGSHVMLGRRLKTEGEVADGGKQGCEELSSDLIQKDRAQKDDNMWLQSVMDSCMLDPVDEPESSEDEDEDSEEEDEHVDDIGPEHAQRATLAPQQPGGPSVTAQQRQPAPQKPQNEIPEWRRQQPQGLQGPAQHVHHHVGKAKGKGKANVAATRAPAGPRLTASGGVRAAGCDAKGGKAPWAAIAAGRAATGNDRNHGGSDALQTSAADSWLEANSLSQTRGALVEAGAKCAGSWEDLVSAEESAESFDEDDTSDIRSDRSRYALPTSGQESQAQRVVSTSHVGGVAANHFASASGYDALPRAACAHKEAIDSGTAWQMSATNSWYDGDVWHESRDNGNAWECGRTHGCEGFGQWHGRCDAVSSRGNAWDDVGRNTWDHFDRQDKHQKASRRNGNTWDNGEGITWQEVEKWDHRGEGSGNNRHTWDSSGGGWEESGGWLGSAHARNDNANVGSDAYGSHVWWEEKAASRRIRVEAARSKGPRKGDHGTHWRPQLWSEEKPSKPLRMAPRQKTKRESEREVHVSLRGLMGTSASSTTQAAPAKYDTSPVTSLEASTSFGAIASAEAHPLHVRGRVGRATDGTDSSCGGACIAFAGTMARDGVGGIDDTTTAADTFPVAVPSKEVSSRVSTCGECGRGRPVKLFIDDDDGQFYCRKCWVEFYSKEPPNK
eukprot:TRINITY_DN8581_c0_g1_i1.p1 TRINITY_DN8581_c0_g1~~TRINITY_DN8581_c0_g1_i1.p1  ORF type:complete len:858 (+),score=151.88 TRINITY_DN8581_c0_g1_i1:56-2629(+)